MQNPAPICAIGPSRPPDPPVPSVTAVATIFTSGTRSGMKPRRLWNALIAAPIPAPAASGASRDVRMPHASPPSAGITSSSHGEAKSSTSGGGSQGSVVSCTGPPGSYPTATFSAQWSTNTTSA